MYHNIPESKIQSFSELLDRGRKNFDISSGINLTGLEESTMNSTFVEQLKDLNNYMYTTYSTNEGDKTLSIEGIIPLNLFYKIEPQLQRQGYWYIAASPLDNQIYGINLIPSDEFDSERANMIYLQWVNNRDIGLFNRQWNKVCSTDNMQLLMNDKISIHFLPPDNSNLLLHDYISNETLEYTDESLYHGNNPLINVIIEDPIVGRISLYSKLYKFLQAAY